MNLGSLIGKEEEDGKMTYVGHNSDANKLPTVAKYPDLKLKTGSDATLVDDNGLHYYMYEATHDKWYKC